jgi:hypothetical protein
MDYALQLARQDGAELFVVAVALARVIPEDPESKALSDLSVLRCESLLKEARARLEGAGIRAYFALLQGDRAEEISDAAARI